MPTTPPTRILNAPTGTAMTCKTWQAEAALRMLHNNLDSAVAERPEDLVVYGGRGKAARDWPSFDAICATLRRLEPDETMLVQSGKPVGVLRTHVDAPRVLIANSNLVPAWATQAHFDDLEARGLMMYGQMTAGSWIYIGTQGILQGTYETFAECGRMHFGGDLSGRLCVTGGCGGMGGAQPLAITLAKGTCLIADVDQTRLDRRHADKYLDEVVVGVDAAIDRAVKCAAEKKALSIGVCCNIVELLERLIARNTKVDVLTDQTSAHDPLIGYIPMDMTFAAARAEQKSDPAGYQKKSLATMARHVRAMLELQKRGANTFDYGNNLRQRAKDNGVPNAFDFPGFVPAFIRPQFCLGRGPFRWVALSGDPRDIYRTDHEILKLFPLSSTPSLREGLGTPTLGVVNQDPTRSVGVPDADYTRRLHDWILGCHKHPEALLAGDYDNCAPRFAFQGLPARICWLGYGQRDKAGLMFNRLVAEKKVAAPIVIGRDHLDCGSVASPNRETEGMKDGTDAVSDWALLNAMVNIASGASWVSFHHGGGVGIGYSQHAGQVIVADGTAEAGRRVERVLTNDPAMGVLRHADAGYDLAKECAQRTGVDIPMM